MFKNIEDVARELATDVCKLEYCDYNTRIRWKDTKEMAAFAEGGGYVVVRVEDLSGETHG